MNLNLTILGQSISFFIFVWFCMKYVWPPIIDALTTREGRIAGGLAAAEKAQRDLEEAGSKSAELLQEGREKAQEFIAQAQKRGDDLVEDAKVQARDEAARIVTTARAQIDQERNAVREELRGQVAVLAVRGAEQILLREVDANAHGDALNKLASEL
ncbi:MAG: F-type H+-transporting ATPase subunit b [Gammaproteobacteria bacterium]